MSGRRLPVAPLVVAALAALVAVRTGQVFEHGHRPLAAVLAPLASGLLVVAVPSTRRYLRWVLQGLLVLVAVAASVSAAGGEVPGDLGTAVVRGLASNLAASWPVSSTGTTVGGVVLATATLSVVAVELAAARRPGPVAIAPVVVLVGLLGSLSAPAGAPPLWALLLLGAGVIAVLRLAEVARRPAIPVNRDVAGPAGASAVAATAVVVLAGVAVTAAVAGAGSRWDPRDQLDPPRQAEVGISPLSLVDGWRRLEPPEVMFRTDAAGERPWRLVALTRYDGRAWMPAADYRPAGRVLRPAPEGVPLRRWSVELDRLRTPWLPAPDGTVEVSRPVSVDGGFGGLLLDSTPPEGLRYELVAATAEPATNAVDAAEGASALVGVEVPGPIVDLAVELTAGAGTDYERALLLAARLRREFELDPEAPGGHSLLVLQEFLRKERPGREEQFVAAYALLAAAVDLPVRVAVGFDLEPQAGGGVAWSSAVRAWPEVEFTGAGWLPFEPVPDTPGQELPSGEEEVAGPAPADQLLTPQTPEQTPPTTVPPPVDDAEPPPSSTGLPAPPMTVVVGGSLLALVGAYVAGVLWLKRRRRRRRRQGRPEDQVTGAFAAGVEVLVDLGAPARRSATNRELVAAGRSPVPDAVAPLEGLAEAATAAVFARRPPGEDDADLAWQRLDEFETGLAQRVGTVRRAQALVSLRSLRRRW